MTPAQTVFVLWSRGLLEEREIESVPAQRLIDRMLAAGVKPRPGRTSTP